VIGKELRTSLKPEPELPASLKTQIDRLCELEERSLSIVPDAASSSRSAKWLMTSKRTTSKSKNWQKQELQGMLMRYRLIEGEVTDPLAIRLIRGIVAELEAELQHSGD
jgi:hypothetical protein